MLVFVSSKKKKKSFKKKFKKKNPRLLVEENRPVRHFSTAQNNFRHTCGSGSGLAVTIPRQSSRTQTFMITSLYTTRVMQQKTDPESITGSPSDPDFSSQDRKSDSSVFAGVFKWDFGNSSILSLSTGIIICSKKCVKCPRRLFNHTH